jgi:hypothetical protein
VILAYLFWHRPHPDAEVAEYEEAQRRFHERLEVDSGVLSVGGATVRDGRRL